MHHRTLSTCKPLLLMSNNIRGANQYGRYTKIFRYPEEILLRSITTSSVIKTLPKAPIMVKTQEKIDKNEGLYSNLSDEAVLKSTEEIRNWIEKSSENVESKIPLPALLEFKIINSKSSEELLDLATNSTLILKHACLILSRLGQLSIKDESIKFDTLVEDIRFMRICNLVQRGNYSQSPHSLFVAIHGLQNLMIPVSADLMKTLSIELKWAMRRCPVRFLSRAIDLFSGNGIKTRAKKSSKVNSSSSEGGESDNILEFAILTLQRRWVEIASGSDFIAVFKVLHFLDNETKGKLEDRAIQLVQGFSAPEMRKIFVALGSQKVRPTPLLRALAFHLSKTEERANAKDLIELTYSLNELTFAEPVVMEKICSDLCSEISAVDNPAIISSLVTSIGQMRYKHKGLIRILDEWIMSHLESLRPFDFAAWLLTCAVLNYQSTNKKEFCTKTKLVLSPKNSSSHTEWVNIVHALMVLNECSDSLLASALEPIVATNIDALGVKSVKTKMKLLNINAIAKQNLNSGYRGPVLAKKFESEWSSAYLKSSDAKLSAVAIEALGNFLPVSKYLKVNQKLESGVFVDAICFMNDKLEPLPVTTDPKKTICIQVAVVVEGYSSFCLGMKEATGSTMLNRNLLKSSGYHVISVPYTEFNVSDKLLRRVKYLEQKIKSIDMKGSGNMPTR